MSKVATSRQLEGSKFGFGWEVDGFDGPTRAKARLVARGDMQREFVVESCMRLLTVSASSVRLLAALACELDLE